MVNLSFFVILNFASLPITLTFLQCAFTSKEFLSSCCNCTFICLNLRHGLPGSLIMDVLMFYLPDETLISSPVFLCCYTPYLETLPVYILLSDTAHCACQPAAGGGRQGWDVFMCFCKCVDVNVLDGAFVQYSFIHLCVCVLMCVTGANSYVRGEVTPSLLSLGVCRGSYQLRQVIG